MLGPTSFSSQIPKIFSANQDFMLVFIKFLLYKYPFPASPSTNFFLRLSSMARSCPISTSFIIISVLSHFTSSIGLRPWPDVLPNELQSLDIASRLRHSRQGPRPFPPRTSHGSSWGCGGDEILWIDVLQATLKHGLAPVSWTDYLYLTIGGTLSNAGISGQTFRHGPQISNVYEMDVLTGKGELVTCSKDTNSELFFAVKWIQMLYDDFSTFSRDQEHLISINGLDYLEGSLLMQNSSPNNWRSSFSPSEYPRISSLISKNGIIYCLEVVKYYDELTSHTVDEELQELLKGLNFLPGFVFTKDVSLVDFLNRVHSEELNLRAKGLWDVPHPWLNLFVPGSRISDFNSGVFRDILPKINQTTGTFLVYPVIRNKWDDRTSAVIPDEDIFYTVGLLHSSGADDWEPLENQNKEILKFCDKAGIKIKRYLSRYTTKKDWMNHLAQNGGLLKTGKLSLIQK
ncbi:Cytokinin dehydrogenase 3 [Vitis vinifera]|uniref:cytokinin dehydrogenase n=1 Tax=Vitis vinifera TaxID=29760 RepID=A0A438GG08_VITVI|nr:Cytokinin dehydrogenase 3 [Vitis vinifera]